MLVAHAVACGNFKWNSDGNGTERGTEVMKQKGLDQVPVGRLDGLQVTVLEGSKLAKRDMFSSDPYCKLYLKSQPENVMKSRVKSSTLNPKWKESFQFNLEHLDDILIVEVWDHNSIQNDSYMGTVELALWDHVSVGTRQVVWLQLKDRFDGLAGVKGKVQGHLKFEVYSPSRPTLQTPLLPGVAVHPAQEVVTIVGAPDAEMQQEWCQYCETQQDPGLLADFQQLMQEYHKSGASSYTTAASSSSSTSSSKEVHHLRDTMKRQRSSMLMEQEGWARTRAHDHYHRSLRSELKNCERELSAKELERTEPTVEMKLLEAPWQNWGRTVQRNPVGMFMPKTVAEVQQAVRQVRKEKMRLKVVGTAHSWSPLFGDDGSYFLSTERLFGLNNDCSSSDPSKWTITIGPGVTTGQLQQYLKDNDICLPSAPVSDAFSWGGIVATGSHGVGIDQGTVSDFLVAVKVVDSDSRVRRFSRAKHPDIMRAIGVSFGLFGVMVELTLQVWPMRHVLVQDIRYNMEKVFKVPNHPMALKALVENHFSAEFFWFPYTKDCWVKLCDYSEEPVSERPVRTALTTFQQWLSVKAGISYTKLSSKKFFRRLTPLFTRSAFETLPFGNRVEKMPDAIHWQKFLESFNLWDLEFCIPVDDDFGNIATAWYDVVEEVERLQKDNVYPMNLVLEMRFVRGSEDLLAPCPLGRHKLYCYIEIITGLNTGGWEAFTQKVSKMWMGKNPEAVPHWGKYHQNVPGVYQRIRQVYKNPFQQFLDIRNQVGVDPVNMFSNGYFDFLFQLVAGGNDSFFK